MKIPMPVIAILGLFFITCINPIEKIKDTFYKSPEIDAFTKAVKVGLPLGYAANCAFDAANKLPVPGVTVVSGFDTFPCNAIVKIAVSKAHPLPVGSDTAGTILVLGIFSTKNSAVMSVFFTNTNVKDGTFTFKNVAFVPAQRDTSGTMVVFASEDVNADSSLVVTTTLSDSIVKVKLDGFPASLPTDSSIAVSQKAWITLVHRPAAASLGAETYTLYGASQSLGVNPSATEVVQAVMLSVTMTPSVCRKNPLKGYAYIRDIKIQGTKTNSDLEMGSTVLTFDSTCTGQATIFLATGVYIGRTGSKVALNLDR